MNEEHQIFCLRNYKNVILKFIKSKFESPGITQMYKKNQWKEGIDMEGVD